jgi:8-oxo-dGTP diphosphatase
MCLCLVRRGAEVLLGAKKTGFGAGRIVGPGGHIEPGESPAVAAARELWEETGLLVDAGDLREVAALTFRFPANPRWDLSLAVFLTEEFSGEPAESDELAPRWFRVDDLPLNRMWDDARLWLPRVLAGEYVAAEITYADDNKTVATQRTVRTVPSHSSVSSAGNSSGSCTG